jgi:hypothetical protein
MTERFASLMMTGLGTIFGTSGLNDREDVPVHPQVQDMKELSVARSETCQTAVIPASPQKLASCAITSQTIPKQTSTTARDEIADWKAGSNEASGAVRCRKKKMRGAAAAELPVGTGGRKAKVIGRARCECLVCPGRLVGV